MFTRLSSVFLALCLCLFAFVGQALAALTVDQQAVVDNINTMVADMTTVAWAFVLSIIGALIGIKVFKKFLNRSTG